MTERFRFVTDDACHWYRIPADDRLAFDLWVYEGGEYQDSWWPLGTGPENYTFSEPECDW